LRFLADTNVLISAALFPSGKVSKVLSYVLETHELVLCSFSIEEARVVFDRKFREKKDSLDRFLSGIEFVLFQTPSTIDSSAFPAIRDVKDISILASAILSEVDILLTGDKDFQDIDIEKPLIFTPSEYLSLIEK
jgi:putative PIN family toxin of toxin-antitoxin system